MPRLGLTYAAWLKKWRRAGEPKWPKVIKVMAIHWTDAAFSHEEPGRLDCVLTGALHEADEKEITLAMENFEDGAQRTYITVPVKMVNRVIDVATVRAFNE